MANTYLTKTFSSEGNRAKWTWSGWVKKTLTGSRMHLFTSYYNASNFCTLNWESDDELNFYDWNGGATNGQRHLSIKMRDTNAWYHIVATFDSGNSTTEDKMKVWINGTRQTAFQANSAPSGDSRMNHTIPLYIGAYDTSNYFFNGLISHVHFTDGYVYDATAFGEYDANGVWKIILEPSVTYGTNGFFILKNGNSVTDQSGNSNNFTVAGGTLTNTEDNPSNVFATWNGIAANLDTTLTNGNTKVAHGSQLERRPVISALGMSSGKYYAEFKALSGTGSNIEVGIVNRSDPTTQGRYMGQSLQDAGFIAYKFNGDINFDGTNTTGFTTTATNDILGVAVDIDNTRVYFYKNGTLINSGGTSFANMSGGDGDYFFCNGDRSGASTYSLEANFGNGYFGTTAVSSAGTNASGNGIFEYDVPTGYTALSTKGLNL